MNIKILKRNFCIIFFVFLVIFALLLYFLSAKRCKTSKIYFAVKDLGISQLEDCYSVFDFKEDLKFLLKKNNFLYSFFKKIYHDKTLYNDLNTLNVLKNRIIEFDRNDNTIKGIVSEDDYKISYDVSFPKIEGDTWFRSHSGNYNHKYNNKDFIDKKNVKKLKLIWKYTAIDQKNFDKNWIENIELNPIFINEKIIFVTPDWKIVALEGRTGKKIWSLQSLHRPSRRGMVSEYEAESNKETIYFPSGRRIYKIDAVNGKKINKFGKNGYVITDTIVAPIIYKDYLISVNIKGTVDIFNKITGQFYYSIPIHLNKNFNGGRPWGGVAFDDKKGIVFINTGNPQPSTYGGNRTGDNKNSASVLAVDVNKKSVIWSFQETAHDLWDFDIAAPPIVHNLKIGKNIYEVVISLTKTGNTLILDRNTGLPIFDVFFERAPKSDLPGEVVSDYQIKIKKPEPFSNITYSKEDFKDLPKNKRNEINQIFKHAKSGWYEPPSLNKDLIIFGIHGGAEWQGGALDPINQDLYIPVNRVPWIVRPRLQSGEILTKFPDNFKQAHNLYINQCAACHENNRNGIFLKQKEIKVKYIPSLVGLSFDNKLLEKFSYENILKKHQNIKISKENFLEIKKLFSYWDNILLSNNKIKVDADRDSWYQFLTSDGLPAQNPPYGYLAKLNLPEGKIIWKSPIGYQKVNGKNLKHGSTNFGGAAVNASGIIFYTGTDDSMAYAIDSLDGTELWSFEMEAAGSTPPIIYNIKGKQYVSFLATGGAYHNYKKRGSTIYTFSLEK